VDGHPVKTFEVDGSVPIFDKGKMKIIEHGPQAGFQSLRGLAVSFIAVYMLFDDDINMPYI
jgi:hypothetical protein